jgi:D-glycero-D-manno-heptose 1,7-bisphosphate phosphatase
MYLLKTYSDSSVKVECVETPADFSPAERLIASEEKIQDEFLLLYCDNYLEDESAIKSVIFSNTPLTLLVEERDVGNVTLSPKVQYEIERSSNSPFVELGYIHINHRDFINELRIHKNLQKYITHTCKNHTCSAVITKKKNKSISNIDRFISLRSNRKTILIDRDGILNKKMPHRMYLTKFEDYELILENIETLREMYSKDTDFIIITNQPGIALGVVDPKFLDQLHSSLISTLLAQGISIIGLYTCVHHWDDNCECRKPMPGMINQAIEDYQLRRNRIVYVGDELKDLDASRNANILGIRITNKPVVGEFDSLSDAFNVIQQRISL